MNRREFTTLFPYADQHVFSEYDGVMVYQKKNDYPVEITEPPFWNDRDGVAALHLPPEAIASYDRCPVGKKEAFLPQWRRHHVVAIALSEPQHWYNVEALKHIKSSEHREMTSHGWGPKEWNVQRKKGSFSIEPCDVSFNSFRVYINQRDYFVYTNALPSLTTDHIDFSDKTNSYSIAIKAMYILSYLGGVGLANLTSSDPLAKALAYFYFHYHLLKFLDRRDFRDYDLSELYRYHLDHPDTFSPWVWSHHYVWYHPQVEYTEDTLKRNPSDVIRGIKHVGNKVYFEKREKKRDMSHDYLSLLQKNTYGISKIGQALLQEACQAYVYCVLGAQAQTRWKIVGDAANSLQTQRVFEKLVEETIKQGDLSELIKSMRIAIRATKVRLDYCISPGLELLPSDMVFVKDSPGYNNVLLIATQQQTFGKNQVNSRFLVENTPTPVNSPVKSSSSLPVRSPVKSPVKSPVTSPGNTVTSHFTEYSLLSFGIALAARLLWLALV